MSGFESDDFMSDDDDGSESAFFDLDESMAAADEKNESVDSEPFEYTALTPKELISTQLQNIQEVNSIFQIPAPTARILLQHFGWDKERLVERYYDGDQEQLFEEAHIVNPNSQKSSTLDPDKEITCEICYIDYLPKQMASLPCGHIFCKSCWNQYLTTKIMEEGQGQDVSCPAHNCNILCDEWTVSNLIDKPNVLSKYQYMVAKAFVHGNRLVRWCPSPGCENAVKVANPEPKPVKCSCGNIFCFGCGEDVHDPVKCDMLKEWLQKCADDSETANWIAANTKECPKCRVTIEKNGGCNHMMCRSTTCKYEFCWVCLGPWEPHGSSWYNCNRFEESESMTARKNQAKSRQSLERYLHYYNRYANHAQSSKFEQQLYDFVDGKMQEMQAHNMSWIEVQYLRKAVDILSLCRTTLKYTYVFAFYLLRNNQSVIFEDNQKDLEMATETLSGYLEMQINDDSLSEIKQKVLDKTQYCESRRKVLLEHVNKGYEEEMWDFYRAVDFPITKPS
eukprot:Nk52_evm4s371 gene=Nk52_evmTU4s371